MKWQTTNGDLKFVRSGKRFQPSVCARCGRLGIPARNWSTGVSFEWECDVIFWTNVCFNEFSENHRCNGMHNSSSSSLFHPFTEVLRFNIRVCVNKCFSLSNFVSCWSISFFHPINCPSCLPSLWSSFSLTDSTKSSRRMQTRLNDNESTEN